MVVATEFLDNAMAKTNEATRDKPRPPKPPHADPLDGKVPGVASHLQATVRDILGGANRLHKHGPSQVSSGK